MSEEKEPTRADHLALAKKCYNVLQFIRINGGLRARQNVADYLGLPENALHMDTLKDIEKSAKRADISRGSSYVERGLLYCLSLERTELGYRFLYQFRCKNDDP
jgi:hypothetical protein